MLVDLLDQSIIAMKEIYELEKSSNDVQKQEKNDKIFSNVVSENHLMVNAVTNSMSQLGFVISQETRGRVIGLLKSSSDDSVDKAKVRDAIMLLILSYVKARSAMKDTDSNRMLFDNLESQWGSILSAVSSKIDNSEM